MATKKNKEMEILLRVKKFDVDECRKNLALLLEEEDLLNKKKFKLFVEMETEKKISDKSPETAFSFAAYYQRYLFKKALVENEIKNTEQKIIKQREILAEKFFDLKTFEISKDKLNEKEKYEENLMMQKNLDEVASNMYRLKNS